MSLDEVFQTFLMRIADSGPIYLMLMVFLWWSGPTLRAWGEKILEYWMESNKAKTSTLAKLQQCLDQLRQNQQEHLLVDERHHREQMDKLVEVAQFNRHEHAKMVQVSMEALRQAQEEETAVILDRIERVSQLALEKVRRYLDFRDDTDAPST